jgi:hypothetical protein
MSVGTLCETDGVTVLPDSDNRTLCITLKGVIQPEAFKECFLNPLEDIIKNTQNYGLLINYDETYEGWSKEAAELSFQSIIDYGPQARKLAYVNPPDSKLFQINMTRPLFGGEIRFFEGDQLDEALKWVKA